MQIYINDVSVEFTLEEEKLLYEVMAALEKNIASYNDFIMEVKINQESIPLEQVFSSEIPLVEIDTIKIKTESILSHAESMLAHIRAIIMEIYNLSVQEEQIFSHKEQILDAMEGIYQVLDNTSNVLYVPFIYVFKNGLFLKDDAYGLLSDKKELENKLRDSQAFVDIFKTTSLTRLNNIQELFIPQLVKVYNLLYAKSQEYLAKDFFTDMSEVQEEMGIVFESIGDVVTSFQMGKDTEGVRGLEKFLLMYEFASQMILRCNLLQLIDTDIIKPVQEKIQENIKSIDQALVEKDIITLCDTLEYEYVPHLQELIDLLPVNGIKD